MERQRSVTSSSTGDGVSPILARGPLRATGHSGKTDITGRMAIGPCEHVDAEVVHLLADLAMSLYGIVGAARTLTSPTEPELDALQQLLVASMAIAATEAEAAMTLCSIDLVAPAAIHVRALGDITRRCILLPGHADIALAMYGALAASRADLAKKIPDDHPVRKAFVQIIDSSKGQPTMQAVEQNAYTKDDQSNAVFITALESKQYSKWNHADIVALADAGDRLLAAGDDIRTGIAAAPDATIILVRACLFALTLLHVSREIFGASGFPFDELIARFAAIASRVRAPGAAEFGPLLGWLAAQAGLDVPPPSEHA
jgi:hypothetical protein